MGFKRGSMLAALLSFLVLPALAVAADGVTYEGSTTILELLQGGGAIKAFEAKTGAKVTVVGQSGSGKGIKMVQEGKVSVAGSGRNLNGDEKKAGLLATVIAYDGLAIYVHKKNPVKNLTKAQAKDIYTGKVKNWKQVGGKDVPITPIIEPQASNRATVQLLQDAILDKAPFAAGIREIELLKDQVVEVSKSEGAVCAASVGFQHSAGAGVKDNIKTIALNGVDPSDDNIRSGAYSLSRPLVLVTKGLPAGDLKKFIAFMLSPDGQAIVEKSFVRLRK